MVKVSEVEDFFYEVNKLYFSEVNLDAHIDFYSNFNSLNICTETTEMFFSKFDERWNKGFKNGDECNIWEVAGLGANEVRICSVLAWLLNQNGSHGRGSVFLEAVIQLLLDKSDSDYVGKKISKDSISEESVVHVESLPLGDRESRVDIEIEGKGFLLFIEAKVYAPQQEEQLPRYLEIAGKKSAGRPYVVSFLTPDAREPNDDVSIKNKIICFSWKDCARVFSEVIDNSELSNKTFIGSVVMQFCEYITDLGEGK